VVRPPAFRPLNQAAPAQIREDLPARPFFCTVFNNYQADLKGMDGLSKILDALPCPLVWCSQRFGPEAPDHPRLVKMTVDRDATLSLIRECSAYLSLSRSEGFGWSVFEAMMFGKPVFSRPTGIAGEFAEKIFSYDTFEDLAARLSEPLPQRVEYDLSAYSPEAFLRSMHGLIRPDSWRPRRLKNAVRYWSNLGALQLSRLMKTA
jgi:glycosyltransferase involved in cell wall biosynthesis